jgi:hypothetical protein
MVDEQSIAAGIRLVRWFSGEARRLYVMLEPGPDAPTRELIEFIRGKRVVSVRDVQRKFALNTAGKAEAALADLVTAGHGEWMTPERGAQGGRPSMRFRLRDALANDKAHEIPRNGEVLSMSQPPLSPQREEIAL